MKVKIFMIFLLIISIIMFGAIIVAQETEGTTTEDTTTEAEVTTEDTTTEAEATTEDTTTEAEATTEAREVHSLDGFVKARLVSVNGANSFTIILNGQEMVVSLYGLDFTESDFYIFDRKHYQYAEWLLVDYQYIWVDYSSERTNEKGNPLVYLHYGPWETELWSQRPHAGHSKGQTNRLTPKKINFWGDPLETYDDTPVEPFITYPEFSTVFDNWSPNYDPRNFGKVFTEPFEGKSGKQLARTWYLRDLNALMLLSGYADVISSDFSRKAEYNQHVAKAKWCRRGLWHVLLIPNPANEDICGYNKPQN